MSPLARIMLALALSPFGIGCASAAASAPAATISAPISPAAPIEASVSPPALAPAAVLASAPAPAWTESVGAIVIDGVPSDTAEVYEDDVPMTFDVGEAKPISAGTHIVSLVVATKTVWASKITISPGSTVHVRIPAKYLTAYQD